MFDGEKANLDKKYKIGQSFCLPFLFSRFDRL